MTVASIGTLFLSGIVFGFGAIFDDLVDAGVYANRSVSLYYYYYYSYVRHWTAATAHPQSTMMCKRETWAIHVTVVPGPRWQSLFFFFFFFFLALFLFPSSLMFYCHGHPTHRSCLCSRNRCNSNATGGNGTMTTGSFSGLGSLASGADGASTRACDDQLLRLNLMFTVRGTVWVPHPSAPIPPQAIIRNPFPQPAMIRRWGRRCCQLPRCRPASFSTTLGRWSPCLSAPFFPPWERR